MMRQSSRTLLVGAGGVSMILFMLATGVVGQDSEEPGATVNPNLIQPPMFDDSRIITAEEELELTASPQSSGAAAVNPSIQIDGLPVLTAFQPLVIHASAFKSDGFDPDGVYFNFSGGYWKGVNFGCIMAEADLPSGVTLTGMFATVYDNNVVANLEITLRRIDNFSGLQNVMAEASTSGAVGTIDTVSDVTIDHPVIVYPIYSYYVTTCLADSNVRLYSVRLYLSVP